MMKIYLKILLLGIIILIIPIVNYSNMSAQNKPWQIADRRPDINRPYINSNYDYLKFADSFNGMVGANLNGAGGYYIRRTTDSGNTWEIVLMDSAYFHNFQDYKWVPYLWDISYTSTKLCIGIGDTGLIFRTSDKGEKWIEKRLDSNLKLEILIMADANYGLVASVIYNSINGFWYETTDGGINWIPISNSGSLDMEHINFINPNLFYALSWIDINDSTSKVKLIKVYNRRKKIDTLDLPCFGTGISFPDENNGWFIANKIIGGSSPSDYRYSQQIYHTSDGGHNWDKQWDTTLAWDSWLPDIKFYDENFGVASGLLGLMLVTTNGGKKWKVEFVNDTMVTDGSFYLMDKIQIVSPTTAFVLGNNDYVYKYDRTLDNFDDVSVAEPPKQDNSLSISPNPASDYIEINVGVQNFEPLQDNIRIYNVLGEIVLNPSPTLPASREGVRIDVSTLPPGVYFLRVGGKVSKFIKF